MFLNCLDRVADWDPQLWREIKGRLKIRNIALAVATSLLTQFLLILYWLNSVPRNYIDIAEKYCSLHKTFEAHQKQFTQLQGEYHQLQAQFRSYSSSDAFNPEKLQELQGKIEHTKARITDVQQFLIHRTCPKDAINMQLWWHNQYPTMFTLLCILILFAVLVVGCYMLISDLAREERRGTLNLIRFSPQSVQSILIGKILGVLILLYLAVLLALPLNLWLGLSAHIPLFIIFGFYAVLVASCAFFYSIALLFSLVSPWFSGLQAWLGGGAVLWFLFFTLNQSAPHQSPTGWLNLFSPFSILYSLVHIDSFTDSDSDLSYDLFYTDILELEWFNLPISTTFVRLLVFTLLNYSFGTYWIWQALNRRFHNPHASLLRRRHSYILAACFTQLPLGFALPSWRDGLSSQLLLDNFHALLSVNLLLIVSLIATLTPHRQACIDWVRYQRKQAFALIQDLLWAENSPALVAIAINLAIIFVPIAVWVLFWPVLAGEDNRMLILTGLILFLNLIAIYAVLVQSILLMKSPFRGIWAAGTVVAAILLPPLVLSLLSINSGNPWGRLWLLTTYPWDALRYTSVTPVVQTILVQWVILSLLICQLTRQLHKLGNRGSLTKNSSRLRIN